MSDRGQRGHVVIPVLDAFVVQSHQTVDHRKPSLVDLKNNNENGKPHVIRRVYTSRRADRYTYQSIRSLSIDRRCNDDDELHFMYYNYTQLLSLSCRRTGANTENKYACMIKILPDRDVRNAYEYAFLSAEMYTRNGIVSVLLNDRTRCSEQV